MRTVTISCRSFSDLQNKVAAVKGLLGISGLGLKESKELIERVTPCHNEVVTLSHDVLEPRYSESINLIKQSGLTVHTNNTNDPNEKIRLSIGDQIRSLVTFSTMGGQYDIAKALLDVMETYCPEPAGEYRDGNKEEDA